MVQPIQMLKGSHSVPSSFDIGGVFGNLTTKKDEEVGRPPCVCGVCRPGERMYTSSRPDALDVYEI
jgi:hypothetical protein